jgi:hypothetical protein
MVNNRKRKKRFRLTRKGGKATVSCDWKSSQSLSTDGYKAAESIAVAWANEDKKGVCIVIEVAYDLDEEEEDLIEDDDSDTAIPMVKKAPKGKNIIGSEPS